MDTSEIDDSVFDFFSDPLERKRGKGTYGDVTEDTGYPAEDYEYDDDFENTSTDGDGKRLTDTSVDSNIGSLNDSSYGTSESTVARKIAGRSEQGCHDTSSDDKWNPGTWRGPGEDGNRGRDKSASRRQGKVRKTPTLKQVGRKKQTTTYDVSSSNESSDVERRDRFTSYRSTTSSLTDAYIPDFEESQEGIDTSLTSDTFSEALVKNDRFSNFGPTSHLSSKDSQTMSYRKKMSLPQVDKSKRVQLTRRAQDSRRSPSRKGQTRTHAARVSRDTGRRAPGSSNPARKPPIPIPLKSDALYCNGELTVNVRGDKRGNPDKNKFNVTITVVHKHLKTQRNPYSDRQRAACRRRWRRDDLDWDIVKHRAVLPGFNTSTDPEVNRRYLQQFGI